MIKAATMKRSEYSPFGKELKAQTHIAKKQYQTFENIYETHEIIKKKEDKKPTLQ